MLPQKLSGQWEGRASRGGKSARTEEKQAGSCSITRPAFHQNTTHTGEGGFFFLKEATQIPPTMLHPLIIGIVTVNTSLTIIYWSFLLGDAYFKWLMEPEDKPKKVVTPA